MVFTSASARKYLNHLDDEKSLLLHNEYENKLYRVCDGEEPLVPDYNYYETCKKIISINEITLKIKHALNVFNTTTKLHKYDLNLDEALIYLAQLSARKRQIDSMRLAKPKRRSLSSRDIIEYEYANYDIEEVKRDYDTLTKEIAALQMEIDYINQTETFSVDLPEECEKM